MGGNRGSQKGGRGPTLGKNSQKIPFFFGQRPLCQWAIDHKSNQEENLGTANPHLIVEPEEGGVDIQDSINNHLRKMSEYKNWIKVS